MNWADALALAQGAENPPPRRDLRTALITLCVGAGMGTATIIERV